MVLLSTAIPSMVRGGVFEADVSSAQETSSQGVCACDQQLVAGFLPTTSTIFRVHTTPLIQAPAATRDEPSPDDTISRGDNRGAQDQSPTRSPRTRQSAPAPSRDALRYAPTNRYLRAPAGYPNLDGGSSTGCSKQYITTAWRYIITSHFVGSHTKKKSYSIHIVKMLATCVRYPTSCQTRPKC